MVRYRSRAADDRPVRARLRELAQARLIPSAADWRVIGNAWVRVDHRWAFSQLTLLSARSKEGLSSVISPILACGAVGEREAHDL